MFSRLNFYYIVKLMDASEPFVELVHFEFYAVPDTQQILKTNDLISLMGPVKELVKIMVCSLHVSTSKL